MFSWRRTSVSTLPSTPTPIGSANLRSAPTSASLGSSGIFSRTRSSRACISRLETHLDMRPALTGIALRTSMSWLHTPPSRWTAGPSWRTAASWSDNYHCLPPALLYGLVSATLILGLALAGEACVELAEVLGRHQQSLSERLHLDRTGVVG